MRATAGVLRAVLIALLVLVAGGLSPTAGRGAADGVSRYSYDGIGEFEPLPVARPSDGAPHQADLLATTEAAAITHGYDDLDNLARASLRRGGDRLAPRALQLADEGVVNPFSLRFTQNSVSPNFGAGGPIDDLAAGLRSGAIDPSSVPGIRVFQRNGEWFSLDNRRLVAFQQAGVDVPYRLATPAEIAAEAWKLTTTNGGTSIQIRGGGDTWP